MSPIAVLGAGSWGTALAIHLARAGRTVRVWARDRQLAAEMATTRTNPRYLCGVSLPNDVEATSSMTGALDNAQCVGVAVPPLVLRAVVRLPSSALAANAIVVSATKGLEEESLRRMSQVIEE